MSKKITYKIYKNIVAFLGLAIFFSLTSCEEDITKANQNKKKNFPSRIIYNANIIKRDSGQVKVRFKAPLLEEYEFVDTPYVEIRKGLYLEFYDSKKPNVPGKLWAKYAKIIEKKQFYEAKGHVKVINNEGQTFVMESIYWDKANRKMYTKDTVFITDKDGSIFVAANGMKAKDDFTEYVFYNNSGDFNVKKMPDVKN
ncbi:LPS export ABC transporter periplasmic protein LptC [Cloacibacterium sp.]|jgi:LPS export ABC transporter protein LptC|uniref:LPS export ABC transporter periplasmic protein LptC n=1 Tax=Cloacibacterium sp. TaxID=1913682 RepID=UPI0039E3EBBD